MMTWSPATIPMTRGQHLSCHYHLHHHHKHHCSYSYVKTQYIFHRFRCHTFNVTNYNISFVTKYDALFRCHTSYVTNYDSQQEEECEENFKKVATVLNIFETFEILNLKKERLVLKNNQSFEHSRESISKSSRKSWK